MKTAIILIAITAFCFSQTNIIITFEGSKVFLKSTEEVKMMKEIETIETTKTTISVILLTGLAVWCINRAYVRINSPYTMRPFNLKY